MRDPRPWYRQVWPWVLIGLPMTSVIAGFVTLGIASHDPDGLVADDYYRTGVAINQSFERRDRAAALGLSARLRLDPVTGDMAIDLGGRYPDVEVISLHLRHATRGGHDRTVRLRRVAPGHYTGSLSGALVPGNWNLDLRPGEDDWRLVGRTRVLRAGEREVVSVALAP